MQIRPTNQMIKAGAAAYETLCANSTSAPSQLVSRIYRAMSDGSIKPSREVVRAGCVAFMRTGSTDAEGVIVHATTEDVAAAVWTAMKEKEKDLEATEPEVDLDVGSMPPR